MSVMVTLVLLKVAKMLAMPTAIFLAPLALMIFLELASSASNSAAVGAETAATGAAGAPASAAGFFGSAPGASGAPGFLAVSAPSGLPSFLGAGFLVFVSSAIMEN